MRGVLNTKQKCLHQSFKLFKVNVGLSQMKWAAVPH